MNPNFSITKLVTEKHFIQEGNVLYFSGISRKWLGVLIVSFAFPHFRISIKGSKIRTNFYCLINSTTGEYCSAVFYLSRNALYSILDSSKGNYCSVDFICIVTVTDSVKS